jgi:endo-1,4-beta-D-glucanase Y
MIVPSVLMLTRRKALLNGAGAAIGGSEPAIMINPGANPLWNSFRTRFVTEEGRVVDNANGGVSHSEGQGWGLLFAVSFDDRKTFETILQWTSKTLRRPHDRLHAWRYTPSAVPPVGDLNNATDGDIFIAAALARAAIRWNDVDYAKAAEAIGRDILTRLVRPVGRWLVLLPAVSGFERPNAVVINLSYYAFPFLADIARAIPSPRWQTLLLDGISLIAAARFGAWGLPPDWLILDGDNHLLPAPGWPPRFSFDAIRIPLWLVWSRMMPNTLYASLHTFWASRPGLNAPAWADLATNDIPSYPPGPGIEAIMRLTETANAAKSVVLPSIDTVKDYYDAALVVLAYLAMRERGG